MNDLVNIDQIRQSSTNYGQHFDDNGVCHLDFLVFSQSENNGWQTCHRAVFDKADFRRGRPSSTDFRLLAQRCWERPQGRRCTPAATRKHFRF